MEPLQGLEALGISFDEWNEEAKKKFNLDIMATGRAMMPLVINFGESVAKTQEEVASLLKGAIPYLINFLETIKYISDLGVFEEDRREMRKAARARRIYKMSHGKHGMKRPK